MNKTHLLLLIFLIISVSFFAKGCSFHPKTSLVILLYHLEKTVVDGEVTAEIKGVAVNDGSTRLDYAEIKGNFYSQDGTLLATGFAKTFALDPGKTWDFTIPYISAPGEAHPSLKIVSYRLEKNSSGAKIIGQAQNDGDVTLSFAQITGNFYRGEAHPSLKILSCRLEKDGSSAKAVGEAQNDGDVTLSSAQITATFYDGAGNALPTTGTVTIVDLQVGEIEYYEIFYPGSNYEEVWNATAEVTSTDYDDEDTLLASSVASTTNLGIGETWNFSILYPKENYEKVDHVTVEVTSTDYESAPAQQVDNATAEVGRLRGSTIMP
jgi:hypothetical protein